MSVREVKVCLLGVSDYRGVTSAFYLLWWCGTQDIGVGKSSLVGRFVHGSFNPNLTTTLG